MSATVDDRTPAAPPRSAFARGPWRSLDELAGSEELRRFVETEFPAFHRRLAAGVDRRTLLKLMGASLALGGLAACTPAQEIVPYVRQPENVVPGRPLFYATALRSDAYGIGAVVESHEGRPTKVEGNPDHPSSLGATDAVMQAAVLELFDPERSRTPLKAGEPASWASFLDHARALRDELERTRGRGAAILLDPVASPTLERQLAALRAAWPLLRLYRHDPLAATGFAEATQAAFGRTLAPLPRLDRADAIVSLDADFLAEGPGRLAHARAFADRRRVRGPRDGMSRLYAAESTPTLTGAAADHRLALRPSRVGALAAELAAAVEALTAGGSPEAGEGWIAAAAADLVAAGPAGLVLAGDHQPARVHRAALAINARLGALGRSLALIEPPDALAADGELDALVAAIGAGEVTTLLVLGANPLHTAPADLDVAAAFGRLRELVHHGAYVDETGRRAHWHIPAAHDLESWSDVRGHDGTASIVQPLIAPLHQGRTAHEVLAALAGDVMPDALALVRATWREALDDPAWGEALRAGVVKGTAAAPVDIPAASVPSVGDGAPAPGEGEDIDIRFVPDPWLRDGRHANSALLQELPRPLTKLVWGNAALVSPALAARLRAEPGQMLEIALDGRTIEAPVWIAPGHPDGTVTLTLGHGRAEAGAVARLAAGYDAFRLRGSAAPWIATGARLALREPVQRMLTTQHHQSMEGRDIVRHASLADFREKPDFAHGSPPAPDDTLYPRWDYPHEAWGMVIDQTACIGCMACVSACQAENNIPTVGPDECERGREMHWLRVDRYYEGPPDAPDTHFQPVPCMHCEQAPCEVVCPVNATVHTHDGLNAQVYNRCIGTRYCSQNCPYKVRRFNFVEHQDFDAPGLEAAANNPNVSVRSRGVMEKCTYCVQRISAARIAAQIDNREIADGEVVTACQQACPTRAITFGNLNDPASRVAAEKAAPHNYALLAELNTRPRTTYLARIVNPVGDDGKTGEGGHG